MCSLRNIRDAFIIINKKRGRYESRLLTVCIKQSTKVQYCLFIHIMIMVILCLVPWAIDWSYKISDHLLPA